MIIQQNCIKCVSNQFQDDFISTIFCSNATDFSHGLWGGGGNSPVAGLILILQHNVYLSHQATAKLFPLIGFTYIMELGKSQLVDNSSCYPVVDFKSNSFNRISIVQ